MDSGIIVIVAVGTLLLLGLAMVIVQAKHRATMARVTKINNLVALNKRIQNVLKTLPPQYSSKEIQEFAYQALLQNLRSILALKPENPDVVRQEIEQLREAREKNKAGIQDNNSAVMTMDTANIVRASLKTLFEIVKEFYAQRRIAGPQAERLIIQIESRMMNAAILFFESQVQSCRKSGSYVEAIAYAKKMVDVLTKTKRKDMYEAQLVRAKSLLKEVQQEQRTEGTKKRKDKKGELEEHMDKFSMDDDALQFSHYDR